MIRCSHCGKLAPAGASSCQGCGMPLTAANSGASMAGMGQAEQQQELPAWLESLRAHERPVANGSGGQPFTPAELVDENSMPSWMRQDQTRLAETGASDAFPALAPGASSAGEAFPGNGLEASSLIDERSLPSWMRGAQGGAQPADGQNFSANSLVQSESVPEWMKNLAPATESQAPSGLPAQAPMAPPPVASARAPQAPMYSAPVPAPGQNFQAHDLVDQQSVPNWMKGAQGPGQSGRSASGPLGSGFAAGELVDQRALPNWMKDQQGREKSDPVSAKGVPVSGSGQGTGMGEGRQGNVGMPASTFFDMNSMPSWMSEGAQGGTGTNAAPGMQQGSGMSAGSLIDMSSMPSWMSEGAQGGAGAQGMQQASGMSAGSLIDMNSMPAWMKNSDNTQQGARGGQARSERMVVPNRPRGDIAAQGQSEAAANVFAAMLGVAASTPTTEGQMRAQENILGVAPGQQPQQAQPETPSTPQPWQVPNALPPPENRMGATPMSSPMLSPLPSPMPSPVPKSPLAEAQPGSMSGMQSYPGYMGTSEASRMGLGSSALGVGSGKSGEAEEPKKKGIFESIRNFFFS